MKKALITTGITGQDGAYSAEFLLKKGMRCKAFLNEKGMLRE